jgi:hypothetical protein
MIKWILLLIVGALGGALGGALASNFIDYNVCSKRHTDCCFSLKSDAFRVPFTHPRGADCADENV